MFLPPYSPDLNPIEEAFSYVKAYLRKHDDLLQVIHNQTDVIESAFESITEDHCNSWIINSGYNDIVQILYRACPFIIIIIILCIMKQVIP